LFGVLGKNLKVWFKRRKKFYVNLIISSFEKNFHSEEVRDTIDVNDFETFIAHNFSFCNSSPRSVQGARLHKILTPIVKRLTGGGIARVLSALSIGDFIIDWLLYTLISHAKLIVFIIALFESKSEINVQLIFNLTLD
jgi:hypothetical protein